MSTETITRTSTEPEGWGWPATAAVQHYFRDGKSLCGRWQRDGMPVAGNLDEHDPEDCRICGRIGDREVAAWYEQHGDDAVYAVAHDDGEVRR